MPCTTNSLLSSLNRLFASSNVKLSCALALTSAFRPYPASIPISRPSEEDVLIVSSLGLTPIRECAGVIHPFGLALFLWLLSIAAGFVRVEVDVGGEPARGRTIAGPGLRTHPLATAAASWNALSESLRFTLDDGHETGLAEAGVADDREDGGVRGEGVRGVRGVEGVIWRSGGVTEGKVAAVGVRVLATTFAKEEKGADVDGTLIRRNMLSLSPSNHSSSLCPSSSASTPVYNLLLLNTNSCGTPAPSVRSSFEN